MRPGATANVKETATSRQAPPPRWTAASLHSVNMQSRVTQTTIAPWLTVNDVPRAITFYETAFGASLAERLDAEDGHVAVAQLVIDGAPFWLQEDETFTAPAPCPLRMIVETGDPEAVFERALAAGAIQVAAVHEEYGWRTCRVADLFGYDWEFARRLNG